MAAVSLFWDPNMAAGRLMKTIYSQGFERGRPISVMVIVTPTLCNTHSLHPQPPPHPPTTLVRVNFTLFFSPKL